MKKNKILASLLSAILVLGATSCSSEIKRDSQNSDVNQESITKSEKLSNNSENEIITSEENSVSSQENSETEDKKDRVKITALSTWQVSDTRPEKDKTLLGQWLEDSLNMDLKLVTVPGEALQTKINAMIASNNLPDLLFKFPSYQEAVSYGEKGLFVNANDVMDKMPNFKAALEKNPYAKKVIATDDNKIYGFPKIGLTNTIMYTTPIIRADLLEDSPIKLEDIKTLDDYTKVLEFLTKKQGTPAWIQRNGYLKFMTQSSLLWNLSPRVFYDYETDSYTHLTKLERSKDYIQWLHELFEKGIMHPDWAVMSDETWEGLLASDKGYFTIDRMNIIGDQNFSDSFDWKPLLYPEINGKRYAQHSDNLTSANSSWYVNAKSAQDKIDKALEFIDFCYNKENNDTLEIGIENKTFTKENPNTEAGIRWLIQIYGENADNKDAPLIFEHSPQVFCRILDDLQFKAQPGSFPKEMYSQIDKIKKESELLPESPQLTFAKDIKDDLQRRETDLDTYVDEMLIKFITGEKSLDEWSSFCDEVENRGLDKILDQYNSTYTQYKDR